LQGNFQFSQVAKGFKEQKIRAGFPQNGDLFTENLACFGGTDQALRLETFAQRANIPSNKDGAACHLTHIAHQAHGLEVELAHMVGQPMISQPYAVSAEAMALDHICPSRGVGLMNFRHPARVSDDQLFQTLLATRPAGVEHGAHPAITEQRLGL
jgi:hypothetical protein